MAEIISYDIAFSSTFGGGSTIKGYLARPKPEAAGPAVLVVHDVFGLGSHIKEKCDKLAEDGFIALAPDLYSREKGPGELPDWNAQLRKLQAMPDAKVLEDLKGAASWLGANGAGSVGLMGFGVGATWAFLLSCDLAGFACDVLYYPIIVREAGAYKRLPIDALPKLSEGCKVLAMFAGANELVPVRDAKRFESSLKQAGKVCEMKIFENVKEDFANPERKDYFNAQAAEVAWKLALDFLRKNVK